MKLNTKAIILITTFLLLPFSTFSVLAEVRLSDINGHWASSTIVDFINKGFINGYDDGTFKPDNSITRAEFVKLFNKKFSLTTSSGKVFSDTATHWARNDIDIAVTNGVANGVSHSNFNPDDPITREEAAKMLSNYKKIDDPDHDKINSYIDGYMVSSWAKSSVEGVIEKGYMNGYSEDNTFRPLSNITRAEAAVTLSRVDASSSEGSSNIIDNNIVSISLGSKNLDEYSICRIPVTVTNKTDKNIIVSADNVTVNGISEYASLHLEVRPGRTVTSYMEFSQFNKLIQLTNIEGDFIVIDTNNYDTLGDFYFNYEFNNANVDSGLAQNIVVNNNLVTIKLGSKQTDEYSICRIPVTVINKSNKRIIVSTDNVTVNGYSEYASINLDVRSGRTVTSYIEFSQFDNLSQLINIEGDFIVLDSYSYDTLGSFYFNY